MQAADQLQLLLDRRVQCEGPGGAGAMAGTNVGGTARGAFGVGGGLTASGAAALATELAAAMQVHLLLACLPRVSQCATHTHCEFHAPSGLTDTPVRPGSKQRELVAKVLIVSGNTWRYWLEFLGALPLGA